jgi:hypothetical protein
MAIVVVMAGTFRIPAIRGEMPTPTAADIRRFS